MAEALPSRLMAVDVIARGRLLRTRLFEPPQERRQLTLLGSLRLRLLASIITDMFPRVLGKTACRAAFA